MKYTEFVKEVEKYGWERTRFQGDVVFAHHNKEWEMDAHFYLSDLKDLYHSYDVMLGHMKNYDLFTMEKLKCTRCGGKVHYNELDADNTIQYTMECKCSKFVKVKGGKVKIPDYWVEAKEEEVEA